MEGGDDPEMRAPMRWDHVAAGHPALAWTRRLVALRRQQRALRIGDFRAVTADHLLAFERFTDRARDSVVVLANPGAEAVRETVLVANSMLMDRSRMVDCLPSDEPPVGIRAGLLDATVPAHSVRVLIPDLGDARAYSPYKRVR